MCPERRDVAGEGEGEGRGEVRIGRRYCSWLIVPKPVLPYSIKPGEYSQYGQPPLTSVPGLLSPET